MKPNYPEYDGELEKMPNGVHKAMQAYVLWNASGAYGNSRRIPRLLIADFILNVIILIMLLLG